jgi:hypothetical protein
MLYEYLEQMEQNSILCYEEQKCRLAAERSEADKPAKAHKTIFAPNKLIL